MGFGQRVKELLDSREMKPAELSRELGWNTGVLSQYIKNPDRSPTLSTACKIALALDVSLDYLGGLIDEPKPIERDDSGNIVVTETLIQRQMHEGLSKLNDEGQMKAADYVRDLAELDRYTERKNASAGDSVQEVAE